MKLDSVGVGSEEAERLLQRFGGKKRYSKIRPLQPPPVEMITLLTAVTGTCRLMWRFIN